MRKFAFLMKPLPTILKNCLKYNNETMMHIRYLIFPVLLGTVISLTACQEPSESPKAQDSLMQELITQPVKRFALTADDLDDLTTLTDYEQRFAAMSDATEDDLIQMRQEGSLSEDFALLRKRDNIQSALLMLKDLNLKTEQGRYIQGIMYSYWEQQNQLYADKITGNSQLTQQQIPMQGIGDFLHAHEQLEHWQAQYSQQN